MRLAALFMVSALLGSCAHTPDVTVYYFPAKTEVNVKVTRLMACTTDNQVFSSQTVTATAINSADLTQPPIPLDLGLLNSALADTSFTAELLADGRLQGINVTETGKAGEIIKSVVSLVKLVIPGMPFGPAAEARFPKLCEMIAKQPDKIVTLKYEHTFDPVKPTGEGYLWIVPLAPESQHFLASAIAAGAELPPLQLRIGRGTVESPDIAPQGARADGVSFRYPARVNFVMSAAGVNLWDGSLPISQLGTAGWLPIARAPAFGKAKTEITLNDDGTLKKVAYGSETGTQAATDAASEVVGLLDGASDAERAAAAEAEVKRIKAERALLKCRAEPETC